MKHLNIICLLLFPTILFSQNITVKQSLSDSDYPEITWATTGRIDTSEFQIFRSVPKEENFSEIHTIHFIQPLEKSDTTEFTVIDTTLSTKGIFTYYIQVKRNGKPMDSETAVAHNFGMIPKPKLSFLTSAAIKDRKAIRLSWKLSNPVTVSSMSLYRSQYYDSAYMKIAELGVDMETFIDVAPIANEPLYYYVVIHDYFGNHITSVRTPAFATFAEKPIRPQNVQGEYSKDTIHLIWKNTGANIIGYRVYRSLNNKAFHVVNDMSANISKGQIFTDPVNTLSSVTKIAYYIKNVSDGFLESNSSDTLRFYIPEHEKILPPAELDRFVYPNGNVRLLWIPPEEGLALGYNIYLETPNGKTKKLNNEIIKLNYFTDSVYRSNGKYTYFVESVGVMNKVSNNTINTTIYRHSSQIHIILDLMKQRNGISISWKKSLNKHITKLQLYKQYGNNKAEIVKSFTNEDDVAYLDTKLNPNTTYFYKLIAIMQNGDKIIVNNGVEMDW
ncbi:MAG: hypothetical protein J7L96_01985 [Bacteroidales bacterium]|nr:hypothetical protein [Bacteroidales bacterium]